MDQSRLDVDALFRQYNVREIKLVETQIKNEIERKKEELRAMVYNRYRDIIEAADAIHVMKSCSKQIENVINNLQNTCETLKINSNVEKLGTSVEKCNTADFNKKNAKYVLAVVIKVLQNSPSKIWYHLDNSQYLNATVQYLFAQHAHVCLDLEKSLKEEKNSMTYLKYGNELWNSIVFLKNTIINKSKLSFQQANVSSLVIMDAIVAVILLENVSLQSIYTEYLNTRIPAVCSILSSDSVGENVTVRDRIIDSLDAFKNTIHHIYEVYYADTVSKNDKLNSALVNPLNFTFESKLNSTSKTIELLKDDGFVVHKIPSYLINFKYTNVQVKPLELEYFMKHAKSWIEKCLSEIKKGISHCFKYVTSLKNLSLIKDAVTEFIGKNCCANTNTEWSTICKSIFEREIDVWSDLISPFYYEQSKSILENYFHSAHENLFKNINENLVSIDAVVNFKTFETDINAYIWSDVDNTSNANEKPLENRINIYKTKAITPALQRLYRGLDEDLNKIIGDIESSAKASTVAPELNNDLKIFSQSLHANATGFSEKFVKSCLSFIKEIENTIQQDSHGLNKLLFIVRFLHTLPSSCTQMKQAFHYSTKSEIKKKFSTTLADSYKTPDSDPNWLKFTSDLNEICRKIFKIWIANMMSSMSKNYLEPKLNHNELFFDGLLAWEDIEIEDEIDADKQTKSKISAPVVCSPLIENMLLDVCQQLTKMLPYTMIQSIVKDLNSALFKMILNSFEQKIARVKKQTEKHAHESLITQNNALQMIFDLKFLCALFDTKDDATGVLTQFRSVCSQLEELVDPFDFDILTPFIQSNINKSISRSSTLFGLLNANERYSRNTAAQAITNDVHNLLLLSNNTQRFELLPISSTMVTSMQNTANLIQNQALSAQSLTQSSKIDKTSKAHSVSSTNLVGKDSAMSAFYKKWFQ